MKEMCGFSFLLLIICCVSSQEVLRGPGKKQSAGKAGAFSSPADFPPLPPTQTKVESKPKGKAKGKLQTESLTEIPSSSNTSSESDVKVSLLNQGESKSSQTDFPLASLFFSQEWQNGQFQSKRLAHEFMTFVGSAKTRILVAAYSITHEKIVKKIIEKKEKGLEVKIIIDEGSITSGDYQALQLAEKMEAFVFIGSQPKHTRFPAKMHNKYVVVDDIYFWSGSFNFTHSADNRNHENALLIEDVRIAKTAIRNFEDLIEYGKIGCDENNLFERNKKDMIVKINDFLSWQKRLRAKFVEAISTARTRFFLCVKTMEDGEIISAIKKAVGVPGIDFLVFIFNEKNCRSLKDSLGNDTVDLVTDWYSECNEALIDGTYWCWGDEPRDLFSSEESECILPFGVKIKRLLKKRGR
jgi:hypothetical protein